MTRSLALLALVSGCTRAPENPPQAHASPDMALRELCNPPPPPAVVAKAALDKQVGGLCDQLVAAVAAGQKTDGAIWAPLHLDAKPLAGVLDDTVRMLTQCRAVAADDDAACERAGDDERREDCRQVRALFHGARSTTDPSWRFPEALHARCRKLGLGTACDGWRDAIRTGNPALCPRSPEELAECPAVAVGDPARCKSRECTRHTRFLKIVAAGGLSKLAVDGEGADKMLAAAALGGKDACAPALAPLSEACRSAGAMRGRDGGI